MEMQEGTFKLKLTSWQSRLAKDFLDSEHRVDVIIIKPIVIKCPASYKIPVEGLSKRDWVLYLTDEQMKIVQEKFNLKSPVSGINITEALIKSGDVIFQKAAFELDLVDWQSRMAQDFTDFKNPVKKVVVNPVVIQCPSSYKIPNEGLSKRDWVLYLTDNQIEIVQEQFNLEFPISGINITEGMIKNEEVVFQ